MTFQLTKFPRWSREDVNPQSASFCLGVMLQDIEILNSGILAINPAMPRLTCAALASTSAHFTLARNRADTLLSLLQFFGIARCFKYWSSLVIEPEIKVHQQ